MRNWLLFLAIGCGGVLFVLGHIKGHYDGWYDGFKAAENLYAPQEMVQVPRSDDENAAKEILKAVHRGIKGVVGDD